MVRQLNGAIWAMTRVRRRHNDRRNGDRALHPPSSEPTKTHQQLG